MTAVPTEPQTLLKSWAGLAVGALGLAALAALVLVLARTPGVANAGLADAFAPALIVHVNLATLVWFLAFAVVLLSRVAGLRQGLAGWAALVLAAAGLAAMFLSPLLAPGPALLSNYFPLVDSPGFVGGLGLFVAGTAAALLPLGLRALRRGADVGAGLVVWCVLPFGVALSSLAASLLELPAVDARLAHEIVGWAPGHLIQFFYVACMMLAWVALASVLGWERDGWGGIGRPFACLALPTLLALPVHALFPLATPEFRKSFTLLMALGTWAGPLWLLWRWRQGLFRSWRQASAAPAAALRGSALLFVVGCLVGAAIRGDNTMVPAHYHGTVGAATLAFIGVAVWLFGLQGRRAAVMVWLYGAGFTLMVVSLTWSGWLGAPRKAAYSADVAQAIGYQAAMALHGLGGLLGVAAAALFVGMALTALRAGTPLPRLELGRAALPARPRDVRQRALAITVLGVVGLGALLALQGREDRLREGIGALLAQVPAIDRLSHVRERQREEIALRFEQGVAMLHAKQFEYAVTAFRRVLAIAPAMPEVHVNLGFALLGLQQFDAARDFFEGATALNPMQGNAYYGLALVWEAQGDLELATGAMRTYLHLAKGQGERHLARARAALWEWEEKRQKPAATGVGPGSTKGRP